MRAGKPYTWDDRNFYYHGRLIFKEKEIAYQEAYKMTSYSFETVIKESYSLSQYVMMKSFLIDLSNRKQVSIPKNGESAKGSVCIGCYSLYWLPTSCNALFY